MPSGMHEAKPKDSEIRLLHTMRHRKLRDRKKFWVISFQVRFCQSCFRDTRQERCGVFRYIRLFSHIPARSKQESIRLQNKREPLCLKLPAIPAKVRDTPFWIKSPILHNAVYPQILTGTKQARRWFWTPCLFLSAHRERQF